MKDDWNAAVDECRNNGIGGDNDDFVLGAIESGNTNLFKENGISHNVSGYPTILYISSEGIQRGDTNHKKYEDSRNKDAFVKWIKDKKNKNKGKTHEGKIEEVDVFNKKALKTNNIGKQSGGGRSRSRSRSRGRGRKLSRKTRTKSKSKRHMKRHTHRHKRTRHHHRRHMTGGGGCGCGVSSLF
jgi:hypothetical protein